MFDQILYDRILAKVAKDPASGCWNWTGPYHATRPYPNNRYGYISIRKAPGKWKSVDAHRAMWIALNGPTPSTVYVCHRCDNPLCVFPDHLFAGAPRDNTRDMIAKNRHNNGKKTICKRGHPLEEENVYITPAGARACKICTLGRLRMYAGWPEHLAYTIGKVPGGYMVDFQTGEFVKTGKGHPRESLRTSDQP